MKFAYYEFVRDWPELVVGLNDTEAAFRASGRPVAADMLLRAYAEFRDGLLAVARDVSAEATAVLRDREKSTRVRPDTMGGGGPRLGDFLVAEPLPSQDVMPGSIGVANEELLDRNVPWWTTNETGQSARRGPIFGVFYGAGAQDMPPDEDAGARREHPLFRPDSGQDPMAGAGFIRNPPHERRFVEKSIPEINRLWHLRYDPLAAEFGRRLSQAMATYR